MNNKILKKDYIFLDVDVKSQDDAFAFIADQALNMKLITSKKALISGFKNRELEGTTGFEDGFSIPHARIKEVQEAAVFVLRFKNDVDWKSMDNKFTKVAIALLIPEGPNGDQHLEILSSIAIKMMDENFKKVLKTSKDVNKILQVLNQNKKQTKENNTKSLNKNLKQLNIVGVTACVVGIAHTYMAEDRLISAAKELGYNVRIETQGSKGIGTPLKAIEIENADIVILATDTAIDTSRFAGKRVYSCKVGEAIKAPQKIIETALKDAAVINSDSKITSFDNKKSVSSAGKKEGVLQHILAGIGYMIPVIVLGGICLAFSLGLAKAIWGPTANTMGQTVLPNGDLSPIVSQWGPLHVLELIGGGAFALMIPILAGFIGNSIAGRAAIAPAMVGAFIGNTPSSLSNWIPGMGIIETPMGFIGAIIAGLAVGYFVRWVNTWRVPKSLAPAMPIFFIPLIAGIGISIIFIYVLGAPIGWLMQQISTGIKTAYQGNIGIGVGLGLGLVLGAMAGFDMGGPINKIAFITSSALITQGIEQPMGAMAAGIPVAPLGMGLTTVLFKKFFSDAERGMGISAMIMGTIGISEGAIPFAIRDPKRAVICNVAGSAVAGGIAGAFLITDAAAHGGPIVAILGAVPYGLSTFYYFIAVAAGVAVTTLSYGLWLTYDAGKYGSVKKAHVLHLNILSENKKEDIRTLNEKALKIKQDGKEKIKAAKLEGLETNNVNEQTLRELAVIKTDKENVINKYKNDVLKSKESYKNISILEKEFIKSKKSEIDDFEKNVNNKLKSEIAKINEQHQLLKNEQNKAKKTKALVELRDKKSLIKQDALNLKNNNSEKLRKDFVVRYNQELI
ncbi:PTS system, fructose-specific IIABC component [Williamsoniiplasma somnilux]|uniref:PTS system, fructose-specific IIABC component n=1 Tax=Williamsoniiplasma somnilux TaxID=215578 RepID=A0A2K8NYK8_9MOLU|nr:fructose-specific PTS transporter subunit EIIC [Williamsoniiplasma somnilux]ATZ18900.1 PTS system, fructose-specific IIABC component [Williamsoniiplasma somnilux]